MPASQHFDCIIIGAGFGGSLLSLILNQLGYRVALIDAGAHPRFAIGESSTPVADMILRDLAKRYDLPQLLPLCQFGSWVNTHPELQCGLKRGFSYFFHEQGKSFQADPQHTSELLVTASATDQAADTHWLRSDVDHFFVQQVIEHDIPYFDQTTLRLDSRSDTGWSFTGKRLNEELQIRTDFVIDASGQGQFLSRQMEIPSSDYNFLTNSHAIYAHFENVKPWASVLSEQGISTADYPFPCDAAALHQVIDSGWLWQLRFRNHITSCGMVINGDHPTNPEMSADDEWQSQMNNYPSLRHQFAEAKVVAPQSGLQSTSRLQRLSSQAAGTNWAMLPSTVGFVDPLHSTGIAHTLSGVERLAGIFHEQQLHSAAMHSELKRYEDSILVEFQLIDQLISGSYRATTPQQFINWSMLYFAAATTYESHRNKSPQQGFLLSDDVDFLKTVDELFTMLTDSCGEKQFRKKIRKSIVPWNSVGLCDSHAKNMYRYTTADK